MKKILAPAAAGFILMSGMAFAQTAVTATSDLNIRSGPGPQYPVVGVMGVDGQADLLGCLDNSKWCQVSASGVEGWAYSDYLMAEYSGRDVVVTERAPEANIPTVTYEARSGTTEAGGAAGIVGGAVTGALIAGPLGAAVGGIAGGALGGAAGSVVEPSPEVRTYVTAHEVDPVYLDGEVVVGAGLPDNVEIYEVPDYEYRYAYVNSQPVLVDPADRRIVYIVR